MTDTVALSTDGIPRWAAKRIEAVVREKGNALDLSYNRIARAQSEEEPVPLVELPEAILDVPNLRYLICTGNELTELPEWVGKLGSLEKLHLGVNRLRILPQWIGDLAHLTTLNLWGNELESLPESLARLQTLQHLTIAANPLIEYPSWLARLGNLKSLSASSSGEPVLGDLPAWLRTLHQLEELTLRGHNLQDLPAWIVHLTRLRSLDLGNNKFEQFPSVVLNLTQLTRLDFSNVDRIQRKGGGKFTNFNAIREIPADIVRLRRLEHLNLHRNGVEVPPAEVIGDELNAGCNLAALRRYFVQLEREGTDYLNEAKLLVVGEPGAGKTTLTRKLLDPGYELRDEESTKGIDIVLWQCADGTHADVRVNVWDFGGQEIYHATHQFFLTRRSVYVLVADTRREDTDFYYWLNTIELLSDGSPTILLLNEKQDRARNLNVHDLQGQFPFLQSVVRTNLATNRGLADVLGSIRRQLRALPHIGTPLPKTWVNVRLALEADARPWITAAAFDEICAQHGFSSTSDKRQLSGFLHDLGVILHFQQDPVLKAVVILKPDWGTEAVYRILDDPAVSERGGRFTRGDLERIWEEPTYDGMHDELLRLMLNFSLAYQLSESSESYIAPQLLPAAPPEYVWGEPRCLSVRFVYDFMPKGIMSQLIVRLHDLVREPRVAWKTGVLLSQNGAQAEVVEDYNRREVRIRVTGATKRELLGVVSHALAAIHRTYPKIRVRELIPCICERCRQSRQPEQYQLSMLRQFVEDGQPTIQCRGSYTNVRVSELLAEVSDVPSQAAPEVAATVPGIVVHGSVEQLVVAENATGIVAGGLVAAAVKPSTAIEGSVRVDQPTKSNNAWQNGLFYLIAALLLIAVVGVLARTLPVLTLPVVIVGGVLALSVVGALQLRNDDKVTDVAFTKLMVVAIRSLPGVRLLSGREPKAASTDAVGEQRPESRRE